MSDRDICLAVGLVGWSQDSIRSSFRTGEDIQAAINVLRALPHEQRIHFLAAFEPIRVVDFDDQGWITLDNRRLYIFRSLLLPRTPMSMRITTYEEAQELRYKLTTTDEGATIVVRSNRNS